VDGGADINVFFFEYDSERVSVSVMLMLLHLSD